jgi:peptide/nickel transport system substrate-binding protein
MRHVRWLAFAMLAAGVGLLATARFAGASTQRYGGILRVGTTGASVQVDPQVAYVSTAWWLEYATAAKLYNWSPHGKLVPEVASGFTVSNGGKTYTFTIRKGFRFSDGTPVTARNFAYAIDRAANHDLASPAAQFITDPNAADIVGATVVNDGTASHVSGVSVHGNRLAVRLMRPDARLLGTLAMPFFQATSTKLPLTQEVTGSYPSAGPFFFSHNDVNVLTSLRRNRFWTRGPGRRGSRRLTGVDVDWNLNEQAIFQQVKVGQLDEDPVIPPDQMQAVAQQYGVNKTRFWTKPQSCLGWIQFNDAAGLLANNAPMRRAINWALDRTAYLGGGPRYAVQPWTHLLPPGFPGSVTKRSLQPYGPTANLAKAKALAAGHFKDGHVSVAYFNHGTITPARAQRVRQALINLGFAAQNVEMKPFNEFPPQNSDLLVGYGWCADSPDPYDWLSGLFASSWAQLFPGYLSKIEAANRLAGDARLRALGKLDLEITNKLAPVAVTQTYNNVYFFSSRVNPRSLVYHSVYSDWSIPALALK